VLVAAALLAALVVVASTGGFAAASAERPVAVAVADDETAYLGYEATTSGTAGGTTNLTVDVTNQFPAGTTLDTVTVAVADRDPVALRPSGTLGSGETASERFEDVPCGAPVVVAAHGDGVDVSLDRSVECG
jgi:hypothetical protein